MTNDGLPMTSGGWLPGLSRDAVAEILSTSSDIGLLVSPERRITSVLVNRHHRSFGQVEHWEGKPVFEVLTAESAAKLDRRLRDRAARRDVPQAVELTHLDSGTWEYPVRYTLHDVDPPGTVLFLGRDLRPVAEIQQQLVRAQVALEREYEATRETNTRYRAIMDTTRDALVIVSVASGRIVDVSQSAATLLGVARSDLAGAGIVQELSVAEPDDTRELLPCLALAEGNVPVAVIGRRTGQTLNAFPTMFRAAGERFLLCRLDPGSSALRGEDKVRAATETLFHRAVEGMVITDAQGRIEAVNEAFLSLVDAGGADAVKGRSLAEFLLRGEIDLQVLFDQARRTNRLRVYSTRLMTSFQGHVPAEISAVQVGDPRAARYAFVMRDTGRAEAARRTGADDGARNMAELVGSTSLKDIVADASDVIERLCIETAVELTRNNRAAAAEMLGLSRQSLYVKLRKFGLLSRDGS